MWISDRDFIALEYEVAKNTHALMQLSEIFGIRLFDTGKDASEVIGTGYSKKMGKRRESVKRFDSLYIETVRNACALKDITKTLGIDCNDPKRDELTEQLKFSTAIKLLERATEIAKNTIPLENHP